MNTPVALQGATILFWAWQTGQWAVAVPCALLIEAARFVPRRWDFDAARLNRIGDLGAALTLVAGVWFYVTLGNPRAITQLFIWLPLAYLPLALSQAYGTHRQISLGVLFWSMRRHRSRKAMEVNFAYPYWGLWIVAASAANRRDGSFEIGLIALVVWALWQARPRSRGVAQWLLLVPLAAGTGYAGHLGLHDLQLWLEGNAADWLGGDGGSKTDPYRADTDLGHIGSLKQSDRIVLRVRSEARFMRPLLLHRASYDSYTGLRWLAKNAPFAPVVPTSSATWNLANAAGPLPIDPALQQVDIIEQTIHGRPVLALPAGTQRIENLAASEVNLNALGAVQVEHRPGFVPYRAVFAAGAAEAVAPRADDLVVPKREAEAFSRIALTPDEAAAHATAIGFPVAVKTAAPGILHKSDSGGVHLGLADAAAVRAACRDLARLGPEVAVSPMAAPGVEIAFGMFNDAQFGPVIMVSAGGTMIEILDDRAFALAPFGQAEALRLLGSLKIMRLLQGARGKPPVDIGALAHALSRFSVICDGLRGHLAEFDVNPIIASPSGAVAVDAALVPLAARAGDHP